MKSEQQAQSATDGLAARIAILVRPHDGWHEFSVADDGPGIAPKYHDRT